MRTATIGKGCSDIAKHSEVGTGSYDRTFAAVSRFGHLRSSQRSAADHIAEHQKLGGCKSGRHNVFVALLAEEVDEVAGGAGQRDGSWSVRADSQADILPLFISLEKPNF
jgi:hypothetical protein